MTNKKSNVGSKPHQAIITKEQARREPHHDESRRNEPDR